MKARVRWVEDMTFIGEAASGHAVVMDGPPELGGHNLGTRPMEMVLLGLGGCTAIDVISILRKSRQAVSHCVVEIDAERADSEPKVYTRIHVHFIVSGADLNENHVRRAVNLSAEKYCSVSIMLSKTAQITHTYELRNE
ncbi:MAG: OsmC family protein [Candidatus Competibacteraceae bacterium]|nr:OsmC family protein [Candidatus Competibacteraceae bacterium]